LSVSLLLPVLASAQVPGLTVPDVSPEASVTQMIGLSEMSVSYHRPATNGRKIWDGLVPYGQVWRAGANENTIVSFSTPVTVNGAKLAAGRYGLHMIPAAGPWTVIFSNESGAWGSFSYDQKEDAARVTATPQAAEFQERLGYSFDEPARDSVILAMRWERVRLPLDIRIDLPRTVLEDYKAQLRGLPRFGWQGWNQAANWAAQNSIDLDDAMAWADRSISMNRNFANLRTKALVQEKRGNAAEAEKLRADAFAIATEAELNNYGYQLLGQQKTDEAIAIFDRNVKAHPQSWNVYDSLAEAYGIKGERKKAIELYTKASNMTTDTAQKTRIAAAIEQLKKQM
jgi:tetratricopeptide (TPR) repeat protein